MEIICHVKNCFVGVRSINVTGATLLHNDFHLGIIPENTMADVIQTGIAFEGTHNGYECQENSFVNATGNKQHKTIGIFSKNTGDMNKAIRRNFFSNLTRSNLVNGWNGNGNNLFPEGLHFICNENIEVQKNGFDIDVANVDVDGNPLASSVRLIQGGEEANQAAGNVFSEGPTADPKTGVINLNAGTSANVKYWYYNNNNQVLQNPSAEGNITKEAKSENTCPVEYCEYPCLTDGEIIGIKEDYYQYKSAYTTLKADYDINPTEQKANTLANYRNRMDKAAYSVAIHELYDSIQYSQDTLLVWIQNIENIGAELWRSDEYLAKGNSTKALQILDAIPANYTLSTAQANDLQNYRAVSVLLQSIPINQLSSNTLTSLAAYENVGGQTEERVRNILTYYGAHYAPEYAMSEPSATHKQEQHKEEKAEQQYLIVYPNPARDFVVFKLLFVDESTESSLLVRDVNGRIIYMIKSIKGSSSIEWKTEHLPSGIYFYQMITDNGQWQSGKVILNK